MLLACRGIRGATSVEANRADDILAATRELLQLIVERNEVAIEDITSAFFTVTADLDAVHPALAARQLGWGDAALLCAQEIPVPDSLPRCIRVLLHVNTTRTQAEIRHVYLREAVVLRPSRADVTESAGATVSASPDHRTQGELA